LATPGIQVIHIGSTLPEGLPGDVPTISEVFTPEFLLHTVSTLLERRVIPRLPGAAWLDAVPPAPVSAG
jgi:hypothetical protein